MLDFMRCQNDLESFCFLFLNNLIIIQQKKENKGKNVSTERKMMCLCVAGKKLPQYTGCNLTNDW